LLTPPHLPLVVCYDLGVLVCVHLVSPECQSVKAQRNPSLVEKESLSSLANHASRNAPGLLHVGALLQHTPDRDTWLGPGGREGKPRAGIYM
jgi:hypothetical protein